MESLSEQNAMKTFLSKRDMDIVWQIIDPGLKKLEMGLNPNRAYFWPKVLTHLWPGYFLILPEDIFLSEGIKMKKFVIFKANFPNPNPNQRWLTCLTRPEQQKIDPTRVKKFWPGSITSKNPLMLNRINN